MRTLNQRKQSNAQKLESNGTAQELSDVSKDTSNILSTELCIYIHAAFMASILIIGNLRLKSIKQKKIIIVFFSFFRSCFSFCLN